MYLHWTGPPVSVAKKRKKAMSSDHSHQESTSKPEPDLTLTTAGTLSIILCPYSGFQIFCIAWTYMETMKITASAHANCLLLLCF